MTKSEIVEAALKLALEALETELSIDWTNNDEFNASAEKMYEAIAAIKEALAQEKTLQALHSENERLGLYKDAYAQPEQEPVATDWSAVHKTLELVWFGEISADEGLDEIQDLIYTSPPQRTWVGLTDDEMEATFIECGGRWNGDFWKIEDADFHPFLRTIEAKLKEKNT